MTTYARNVNDSAVDVTTTDPTTIFYPDVAAQFITVPDVTVNGATLVNGAWVNPSPAPVPPPPATVIEPPMAYYLSFTPAERIAIKKSTDPVVMEAWESLQLAISTNTPIDTSKTSVQELLTYLSTTAQQPPTTPASPYLATGRMAQILAGVMQ